MAVAASREQLAQLFNDLTSRSALVELAAFAACLAAAWAIVRLLRGNEPVTEASIWFGRRVVDGILFPLVALLLALMARWLLAEQVPAAVFRLVVPVLVSLAAIRLTARVLHQAFPNSGFVRVVERSVSWAAWIAVVLWVTGLLPAMLDELDGLSWKIGGSTLTVRNLIEGTLSALVVMVLALWASSALEERLLRGSGPTNLSMRKIAANALRVLLLFVGLLLALSVAGIDLTALGVFGGAIGVGIGFGLQKLAANYISGFVILAENSLRIGDLVRVDGFEGRIVDITTRFTKVRAGNGRESIVPNEMMMTQRVENITAAENQKQLSTVVQVAYGTDVDRLMPELLDVVRLVPRVLAAPAPMVNLTSFAANGIELTFAFWIGDPANGQVNVLTAVNLALLRALNERGIEIPFPQRVLRTIVTAPPEERPAEPR